MTPSTVQSPEWPTGSSAPGAWDPLPGPALLPQITLSHVWRACSSEREAWEAVLDVLVGYGMPPAKYQDNGVCHGLCSVVTVMYVDGVVDREVSLEMRNRIRAAVAWGESPERRRRRLTCANVPSGYLAPLGEVLPRIKWVERFIKDCA